MAQDYFIAFVGEFIHFSCLLFQIVAWDIDVQILIIICHIFFILLEQCVVGKEEELPSISR